MSDAVLRYAGFKSRQEVHQLIEKLGCKQGPVSQTKSPVKPLEECSPAEKREREYQAQWRKNNPGYKDKFRKKTNPT